VSVVRFRPWPPRFRDARACERRSNGEIAVRELPLCSRDYDADFPPVVQQSLRSVPGYCIVRVLTLLPREA
jgi:hypothetical protein